MKKILKTLSLAVGMTALAASFSVPAQAALQSGFDSINFDPAISNNTDYFGVYSSRTVGKHGWNAGFYLDYAQNPLEFGAPPGNRIAGVVDHQLIMNSYATYGITSWMSVGINIPVILWNDVRPLLTPGPLATFSPVFDSQTNLGDIRLEFKFRLRNNEDRLVGVALVPFVNLPSGPSSVFAGHGSVTGGAKVVVDFNIHDRVNLALNVGYFVRDDVTILNARMDDQLLLSIGLNIKIIERLHFLLEAATEPVIRDFFDNEVQTPFEARAGFRVKINENFNINVGGGAGLTIGVGTPDFRAFLGLNYNWAPAPCPDCPVAPPPPCTSKIKIDQVIHFAFDKAVIKPVSYPILQDVAAIIKSNANNIGRVTVAGHTDSIGSDAYNDSLSDRRANAVKEYLTSQGVSSSMLESVGYGEKQPIDTNDNEAGRAKNRRVEFNVQMNSNCGGTDAPATRGDKG